jgi:hypothetical protein
VSDSSQALQTLLEKDVAKERELVAREKQREAAESLKAEGPQVREEAARERLHVRGLIGTHVDPDRARVELTEEERVRRASRPKTRRWRELAKLDEEIDRLTQKQADAGRQLQEAEQRLSDAPNVDAQTLAAWLADGEKGERPAATLYERQRDRDAARLLVEARSVELDSALEKRLRFIEKNRRRMLDDARNVERARVALGLEEPVKQTLHTSALIEYGALVRLLDSDAAVLASKFSVDQARKLGEPVDENLTPEHVAMWSTDERAVAWGKSQLERAREIASYSLDPHRVAFKARDLRP